MSKKVVDITDLSESNGDFTKWLDKKCNENIFLK